MLTSPLFVLKNIPLQLRVYHTERHNNVAHGVVCLPRVIQYSNNNKIKKYILAARTKSFLDFVLTWEEKLRDSPSEVLSPLPLRIQ